MPITREFLDVCRPPLSEAAAYLRGRFGAANNLDLSQVILVVPGGRAGRRLLEILVDLADQQGLALFPPEIVTIGALPERLYEPKLPFATPLTQRLAWAKALRETSRDLLVHLLPRPPETEDDPAWLQWGDLLRKEHAELAADALDFSHVADKIKGRVGPLEIARWQTLRDIQQRYLHLLDQLQLWDPQTARLTAVIKREFHTDRPVVLLGVVDLNQTQRDMLDQIADQVTVLVPAAPHWRPFFDSHGCLDAAAWNDPARLPVSLTDAQVVQVDGPVEQAAEVVRVIASWDGRYRADEITVGFPDESLVPQVERQLRQCGLDARWGPGRSLLETRPFRLLDAIARWLHRTNYPQWAGLLRHPDVGDWLVRNGAPADWLNCLDQFYNEHLPASLRGELFLGAKEANPSQEPDAETTETAETASWLEARDERIRATLERVVQCVETWLGGLRSQSGGSTPNSTTDVQANAKASGASPRTQELVLRLDHWSAPLLQVLTTIYSEPLDLTDEGDAAVWQACQRIRQTLEDFGKVPETLRPLLRADDVIRLVSQQAANATAPARHQVTAIELVGWLELPLDDSPALIVTSLNEGHVPQSVNADPFLPNTLRAALRLDDNARRFARDAYALEVMLASRPEVRFIVARRDAQGDPVAPSRLLFATDVETVARRALRLFDPPHAPEGPTPLPGAFVPSLAKSAFAYPSPAELLERFGDAALAEPLRLTVSDFKSYLACPYRFLLTKVARAEAVTDEAKELDGGAFGSLAHDVLGAFGRSDRKHSRDPEAIFAFLCDALATRVAAQYGTQPRPAVQVQVEQLRMRLQAFAELQAQRESQGWRIEYVEEMETRQQVELAVDGLDFRLVGRIDRIDVHGPSGRHGVFDYKTSDQGDGPGRTHRRRDGRWIDLQLPLYRHLVRALRIDTPVDLGYIVLPKDITKVQFVMADWSPDELAEADETAWEVVRLIRQREFDPAPDFGTSPYDDYARICLANVLK